RIGAGGRNKQIGLQRTRHRYVVGEHVTLVDEHVGSGRREALIVRHVLLRHPDRNAIYERHWPGRIADVLIVRLVRRRRWIKRQLASRLKVQRLLCRTLWRPLIVLSPLVDAGVKHVRLWELHLSFVLEEVIEERQLDVLAIEDAGLVTKLSVAQRISVSSRP